MRSILAAALLAATPAAPAQELAGTARAESAHGWAPDSVFYLAFVRSFADSTQGPLAGDGVGDLRGMIERLDYLNDGDPTTDTDLGITGLWLLPIAQSPSYHGYDTTDYYAVDDEYGTMDDLRELVAECHARGIKVVLDLVLNHSADEHPWFIESIDPGSDKRGWYVWADPKPDYPGAWGQVVWHDHHRERAGASYYGGFWHGMPDLNYRSDALTEEMKRVTEFWIDEANVDGYRLDAIKHLIEDGPEQSSTPSTLAWLRDYNAFCDTLEPAPWLVGEVWAGPDEIARYIGKGLDTPALDSAFDFPLSYAILEGLRDGDPARLRAELARSWETYGLRASPFLSNHDTTRTMSVLEGNDRKARAAATLLLTAPGTPFIYYGEEVGMAGTKPDPDLRTPFHWQADADTAGFTTGTPWRAPHRDVFTANLERQQLDDASLWSHYRDLIRARHDLAPLRRGSVRVVDAGNDDLVALVREHEGERVLVVVNASGAIIRDYGFDDEELGVFPTRVGVDALTGNATAPVTAVIPWRPFRVMLPHGSWVIELND
ncbi:MAG: alpha-amylase family glycosyl hydrolase [Phycisphaerales bacterium]